MGVTHQKDNAPADRGRIRCKKKHTGPAGEGGKGKGAREGAAATVAGGGKQTRPVCQEGTGCGARKKVGGAQKKGARSTTRPGAGANGATKKDLQKGGAFKGGGNWKKYRGGAG